MTCRLVKIASLVVACLVAVGGWICTANAETILEQSAIADKGTYEGTYFKLSDTGFTLTGDPLAQTVYLESITFKRDYDPEGGGTDDDLYLKVFTGATGGSGTFMGVSSNTIDVYNTTVDGADLKWLFSNLELDKDTTYSYVVGLVNDSSNPSVTFRFKLSGQTTPLETCAIVTDDAATEVGYAPYLKVATLNVPEPSTVMLMITGLTGLLAYAWRKRR